MTIESTAVLNVLASNVNPSSDGKSFYYNLAVMQNGEVANLSCTEEVYNLLPLLDFVPMKLFRLHLTNRFGGKFESFRITGIEPYTLGGASPKSEADNSKTDTDSKPETKSDSKPEAGKSAK